MGVKRTLGAVVAASFLAAVILARATHPGHASTARSGSVSGGSRSSSVGTSQSESAEDESSEGEFSIGPSSQSTPQVQTNVS
jgi:hypothetical protein